MLDNYLNRDVIIEEKMYEYSSTLRNGNGRLNKIEGIITSIDDEFIEIDNKMLIARKFIYRIILK